MPHRHLTRKFAQAILRSWRHGEGAGYCIHCELPCRFDLQSGVAKHEVDCVVLQAQQLISLSEERTSAIDN